jgi:branched-chain amino acid transport system substrate-binding protein
MQRPLLCSAASDKPTSQGYKYVFDRATLAGSFTEAGFAVAKGLSESTGLDLKKVAVIYEDGAYGTSGNAQADEAAKKYGITLTARIAFHTNTPDLSPVVSRAVASGAKSLLLLMYTGDAVNIVRSVRTLKAKVLILGSGAWNPTMVKMGDPAEGLVALSDWNEDLPKPGVKKFLDAYKAAYGIIPGSAASWGYSDAYYLKEVLETAKSTDPKVLRDTIASLKVSKGPAVDVMPFDTYGFDEHGLAMDQISRVIATQLQNDKMVTIWPPKVASAKIDTDTFK